MRKAFIHLAVDLALAENGYPTSFYGWKKPGWLEVWTGSADQKPLLLHLPAIKSFKKEDLIAELSQLRAIGPPLEAPMRLKPVPEGEQIDLEDLLRSLDSAKSSPEAEAAHVITSVDLQAGVDALRRNNDAVMA